MLTSFWHWYVIIITIVTIIACFWLLQWTKGISNRKEGEGTGTTGHVWDEDLVELNNPLPKWWLQLFYATIAFSIIYMVLFPGLGNVSGVLGWSQEGQWQKEMEEAQQKQDVIFARYREMDNEALIADAEANATGQRLFANSCAMCHGSDGRGARGFPNLADNDWLYGDSFAMVEQSIRDGRAGLMPVMVGTLGDGDVDDLVAYVQSMSGQQADTAMATKGKTHFDTLCVACMVSTGAVTRPLVRPG